MTQDEAALRSLVAAQSVGASNLYQMMANRIIQPGLGTTVGLVDSQGQPIADASNVQVQNYLATRRSQDKNWYAAMSAASPTTVARETLFVLAEIREQLFTLQKQNERMLATMSVMEMQNTQLSKLNLMQLEQAVTAQINQAKGIQTTPGGGAQPQNFNLPGLPSQ